MCGCTYPVVGYEIKLYTVYVSLRVAIPTPLKKSVFLWGDGGVEKATHRAGICLYD